MDGDPTQDGPGIDGIGTDSPEYGGDFSFDTNSYTSDHDIAVTGPGPNDPETIIAQENEVINDLNEKYNLNLPTIHQLRGMKDENRRNALKDIATQLSNLSKNNKDYNDWKALNDFIKISNNISKDNQKQFIDDITLVLAGRQFEKHGLIYEPVVNRTYFVGTFGSKGFPENWKDISNQVQHYAAAMGAGYYNGLVGGVVANTAREILNFGINISRGNFYNPIPEHIPDIKMGTAAAERGAFHSMFGYNAETIYAFYCFNDWVSPWGGWKY